MRAGAVGGGGRPTPHPGSASAPMRALGSRAPWRGSSAFADRRRPDLAGRPLAGSDLFFVLPLARGRIFVDAGQLACRGILEDLVRRLEVPYFLSAVAAVPDEVAHDRKYDHERIDDQLWWDVHAELFSIPEG